MGGRAQEMAMTDSGLYKFSVWDQKLNEVGLDQNSQRRGRRVKKIKLLNKMQTATS